MKSLSTLTFLLLSVVMFAAPVVHAVHEPGHTEAGANLLDSVLEDLQDTSGAATTTDATGFSRNGIYGCTGAEYGAVGMQGPGGSHVPVFDDAVFDQIRLLTYKECLLDGIAGDMRETLISDIIRRTVSWTNTGFDGNPAYITNLPLHMLENVSDPVAERFITGPATDSIAEPYRQNIRVSLARSYSNATRKQDEQLKCDVAPEKLVALQNNDFFGSGGWSTIQDVLFNSNCNSVFATLNAENELAKRIAAEQQSEQTQLDWGSGFRSVTTDEQLDLGDGQSTTIRRVVTPGFMVAENLRQTIGTGLRQTENADEIDEIVSSLMSYIGVQLTSGTEGFSGLSQILSGQDSYINRLVSETAANTRNNMTGAAASIVNNVIRIEQEYIKARRNSMITLLRARAQLESWESICWSGIIEEAETDITANVCARSSHRINNTCSGVVTFTKSLAITSIGVYVPEVGHIGVYGQASRSGSIIDVTAQGTATTVGPLRTTPLSGGLWSTTQIDLTDIPDGIITISATETLPSGGGTLAPITAEVLKETTITGIELTTPMYFPAVTLTAKINSISESATIATSTERSRLVIDQNIKPIIKLIQENIELSVKALEVLDQIRVSLESTVSASGQRFILERLDQLVAARVLHTEAQLREAISQVGEIDAAMNQLLEDVKEGWEEGWCIPENWEQHKQ